MVRALLTGAAMVCCASSLAAAPPELRAIHPAAVQSGVETRLQVLGRDFTPGMQLLLPFPAEVKTGNESSGQVFFTVKPAKDVVPGVYPARVRSNDGVSNLVLLPVTDLPIVREVEPNGRLKEAQKIEWPCMIAGTIGGTGAPHPSKDVDVYRFTVKAGQRLTFACETRRLGMTCDLLMRLRNSAGRELAYGDDAPGLGQDPRLDHTFTEAGEYFLEVHLTFFSYHGRNFSYLVKVGDFDYARSVFPLGGRRGEKLKLSVTGRDGKLTTIDVQAPKEPWADEWMQSLPRHAGSLPWRLAVGDWPEVMESAASKDGQKIDWPATVNARIGKPGECDRYRLSVKPGQKIRARVDASYLGSALQGVVRAYDPGGKLLGENFQRRNRIEVDPLLDFTVPDNVTEVVVALEDHFGRGGVEYAYRLTLERGGDDFELTRGVDFPRDNNPQNDVVHLPVGKAVAVAVRVLRRGQEGPITLRVVDPPAGVVVRDGTIEAGKPTGEIIITVSDRAPAALFELDVIGEAKSDGEILRRRLLQPLHLAEPYFTNMPWNWRLSRLVCVKMPAAKK